MTKPPPMSIKKSLAWVGMAQAISVVLQFSSSVVLARYLTPYEMGIFAVAVATVGMLSLFQQLGLNALIVREEVLTREVTSTAFTINALISILLSLVIVGASYAGAAFLGDEGVGRVLRVLAITPLFGIFSFLPGANLERSGRFRELALIGTANGVITAATTIGLAMLGFKYMSIAYAQVVSSAAFAIMLIVVGRSHFDVRTGFAAWRRIGDFGFQMLAISGISNASLRLSEIALGRLLGLGALGLFNRANALNSLIWNNIHLAAARVILVDFAELHRQGISLRDRYIRTVAMVTAVLWPAFAGLAVIAEPFIRIVYGDKWVPALTPFVYLAISSMILSAITMTWELFTATGQLRTQTRIEFIRAILSFLLFFGGCLISLEAAAAARVLDAIIALFMYRPHLNRMTNTTNADFWGIYAQAGLLTLLGVAPAAVLMATVGPHAEPALIAGAITSGILLWGVGLFAMKHPLATEAAVTLRHRFPKLLPR